MRKLVLSAALILGMTSPLAINVPVIAQTQTMLSAPQLDKNYTVGFSVKWTSIKNANHYQTQVSTTSNFDDNKTITEDKWNSRWIGNLQQNTTYYVRYRAVYKNKNTVTYSQWSNYLKQKTEPRFPLPFSSSYKKGLNYVDVHWTHSTYAQKYRVMIADNNGMSINVKQEYTKGTNLRINMSSRNGQPKFVRVFAYNDKYMRYSQAKIDVKPASLPTGKGEKITLATQNLLCVTCYKKASFPQRAPLIINDIKKRNPDVLFVQEGRNSLNGTKVGQQTAFYNTLKKQGYGFNVPIEKNGATGDESRVIFKTGKFSLVKKGSFAVSGKRNAIWVLLKSKKTGKQFYAISVHLNPYITVQERIKDVDTITRKMNGINNKKYPQFMGGDMNSSVNDQKGNTNDSYMKYGWTDAGSAQTTKNLQYGTYNSNGTGNILGSSILTPSYGRIDYLYSINNKNYGWLNYTNNVTVSPSGKITSKHGSDHNMVIGTTTIE